nr:O-antigen ligase family protein [Nitrospirota bacterium]
MNTVAGTQELPYAESKQRHGVSTGLYIGLWIFFLFLYLRPQDLIPGLDQVRPVLVLMAVMVVAFLVSNTRGPLQESSPFFKALVLFGGITIWSVPFSYYRHASFEGSLDFLKVVVACFLIIKVVDSFRRVEKILLMINAVMVVFALHIARQYLAGLDHGQIKGLVGGTFENPNDLSVNFVLFLPMLYYYFLVAKNTLLKLLSLAMFGLVLFGIVGCQSRGGMLGAVIVLGLLFLKTEKKSTALVAGGLALMVVITLAPGNAFERLKTIATYKEESSAYGRVLFYESSLRMMLARPFTGVGIDAFQTAYAENYRNPEDTSNRWPDPHSSYFQIIGELGVPGILTYLFMIYVSFRSLNRMAGDFKKRPECERRLHFVHCLRIGLVGFLFTTIFQSASYVYTLYNLMALVVVLERVETGNEAGRIREIRYAG